MSLKVRRSAGTDREFSDALSSEIGAALEGGDLLWIDVLHPDDDDITTLRDVLSLPPLVLEDIDQISRTATFRHYGDDQFSVFYALSCSDGRIDHEPLAIYAGHGFLVTIRQNDIPALRDVGQRWQQDAAEIGDASPIVLLYSLMDAIVDSYFPVLDEVSDQVDDIEDRILSGRDEGIQREIVRLRRSLVTSRRILAAEREALIKVFHSSQTDHPMIGPAMVPYFQDIYDHVNRATETLDSSREMLASTMDAYLSLVNNELNVVVRRLTSWTIILMVVTLVAGIYGMNFQHMPELGWRFGYPLALGLMLLLGAGMVVTFRRIKWL